MKIKRVLKWVGIGVGVLIALAIGGAVTASCVSQSRQSERYDVDPVSVQVPSGPEAVAEGERLYRFRGCVDCHAEDGTGRVVMDAPPIRLVGSNLTEVASSYSDDDLVRAIRHGVAKDGRPLVFMPSYEYYPLSNEDVGYLIAYIRSLPEKESDLPPLEVRMLGRVLHVAGKFPLLSAEMIDHDAPRPQPPEPGVTEAYGEYLAISCRGCHGEHLSGGPMPGAPKDQFGVPSNLTPHESGLAGWSEQDFIELMRKGVRPDGSHVNEEWMPFKDLRHMTDTELRALYKYLASLEPRPFGNR